MTMVLISGRKVRIRKGHGVPEAAVRVFPGGLAVKTPCSQCRAPVSNLWSGN